MEGAPAQRAKDSLVVLLGLLGLLTAVGATWLNVSTERTAITTVGTATPTQPPPSSATASLPTFSPNPGSVQLQRQPNLDTEFPFREPMDVIRYTVQRGDSVFGIAKKFSLKPETILWGSYDTLKDDPHSLRPGMELNILPVDGTYYQWSQGDDLEGVAESFGVETEAIIDWPANNLDPVDPIVEPGQWLIVPGGKRPLRQWLVPTIARGSAGVGKAYGPGGCSGNYSGGIVGTGGFIWPTSSHRLSGNDYWSGHLAIDIAAGQGARVGASDSGVVVFAGWATNGYGNMVMLDHGNGWQTLYAHLSSVLVGCGQNVYKGNRIGLAGSTGRSTGAHLHFEVRFQGGYVNPWYVLP